MNRMLARLAAVLFALFVVAFGAAVALGVTGAPGEVLTWAVPLAAALLGASVTTGLSALLAWSLQRLRNRGGAR